MSMAVEALERFKHLVQDIIRIFLMDIQMPVMNGLEVKCGLLQDGGGRAEKSQSLPYPQTYERDGELLAGLHGRLTYQRKPVSIIHYFKKLFDNIR